jgi:hypothetical protein
LEDATHHHMEDIMGHSTLMLRSSKVDFSSQPCTMTPKTSYGGIPCQKHGNINAKDAMPFTNLQLGLFHV